MNEFFDQIYCINLLRRTDRLESFTQQAQILGFTFRLVEAIDALKLHDAEGFDMEVNRQRQHELACKISHARVLRDAQKNNYKTILILEDDAVLKDNTPIHVEEAMEAIERRSIDWQMLYFGYSFYNLRPIKIPIDNNLVKLPAALTTHAYAVNCKYIPEFLDVLDYRGPIDNLYRDFIHPQGKTYGIDPVIATQAAGFSDIQGREMDYKTLIK